MPATPPEAAPAASLATAAEEWMKEISLPPGNGGPRASKRRRTSALPRRAAKPRNLSVGELQLTTREKEILRFLAFGLGSSAIARELSISPATVRNHAQRILAK